MNLLGRVKRLENVIGRSRECIPEVIIQFVEPVYEPGKGIRPGRYTGELPLLPGGRHQRLDAEMTPIVSLA